MCVAHGSMCCMAPQETIEQLRASNVSLKEQMRETRERLTTELHDAETKLRNEQRHNDATNMQLQEELNRVRKSMIVSGGREC
jgi:sugar-specific transcriptional regulator TrmB